MNMFPNPQYKGSFLTGNTAKPIAGIATRTAWIRPLQQAKLSEDMVQGTAVSLINVADDTQKTFPVNAGGLHVPFAPNVLKATPATDHSDTRGFIVESPNFVLEDGDAAPAGRKDQIVYVALIGSGAELYLKCDNSLAGVETNTKLKLVDGVLQKSDDDTGFSFTIMSHVVFGVAYKKGADGIECEDTTLVKVKI